MCPAGVSPIIRAGDSFDAEFTVRNASEQAFTATVNAKIEGVAAATRAAGAQLAPGEGKLIELESGGADGSRAS